MRKLVSSLLALILFAQPALSVSLAESTALPTPAVAGVFGPAEAQAQELQKIYQSYAATPDKQAALNAALGAVTSEDRLMALEEEDPEGPAATLIHTIAHHFDKQAAQASDPAAARKASAALLQKFVASPGTALDALVSTYLDSIKAPSVLSFAAPNATLEAVHRPSGLKPPTPADPHARGGDIISSERNGKRYLKWNGTEYVTLGFPSDGDDVVAQLSTALDACAAVDHNAYNEDIPELAQKMVDASKAGKKVRIVMDWSNAYPELVPGHKDGAKRSAAIQMYFDNIGPNLELIILKGVGLSPESITHRKDTIFYTDASRRPETGMLQSGSANYTVVSMSVDDRLEHWEAFGFTANPDRVALGQEMFEWELRRGVRITRSDQQVTAKQAALVLDPKDPIPVDRKRPLNFHGAALPLATFAPDDSPNGPEAILETIIKRVAQSLHIPMFAPFFTPLLIDAVVSILKAGKLVEIVADEGEGTNAAKTLLPMAEGGAKIYFVAGYRIANKLGEPINPMFEKMHIKGLIADPTDVVNAIAKYLDSGNVSGNAFFKNAESYYLWQGFFEIQLMMREFNQMKTLARLVPVEELRAKAAPKSKDPAPAGKP